MKKSSKTLQLPPILEGQKAVVTGGSAGIGAACVRALASAGADVVINYRKDREAAEELAGHHIRVLAVAPGAVRTRINTEAWETQEAYDELMKLVPANRIGEPRDIRNVLVWLASDYADYVTGTTTYVDDGMMLYPGFASGG